MTLSTFLWLSSSFAIAIAFACARSTLTSSVLEPLRQIQLSKADKPVPIDFITKKSLSYSSLLFSIRAPAITSEWPPIYLVRLWLTISAPSSNGLVLMGVANVLSTTSETPVPFRASAIFFMSKHLSVGLVGVSNQQILVFGLIYFLKSAMLLKSESVTSTFAFNWRIFRRYLWVPP